MTFPSHSAKKLPLYAGPQPQTTEVVWFGLFPFRSPLLRESHLITFSSGYLDVSVPRVCLFRVITLLMTGCPIRRCMGHRMLAPYHTFSQLTASFIGSWRPRHPPYALIHLTYLRSFAFVFANVFLILKCLVQST